MVITLPEKYFKYTRIRRKSLTGVVNNDVVLAGNKQTIILLRKVTMHASNNAACASQGFRLIATQFYDKAELWYETRLTASVANSENMQFEPMALLEPGTDITCMRLGGVDPTVTTVTLEWEEIWG